MNNLSESSDEGHALEDSLGFTEEQLVAALKDKGDKDPRVKEQLKAWVTYIKEDNASKYQGAETGVQNALQKAVLYAQAGLNDFAQEDFDEAYDLAGQKHGKALSEELSARLKQMVIEKAGEYGF